MKENQNSTGFEKARKIEQKLQAETKKSFKPAFSVSERGRKKARRKQKVTSAVEAKQLVPELKNLKFQEKPDFWKKSKLKGRKKVAIRNAIRNKLIKKYGLFAYKHQIVP